jgi:hypothetical protein
MESSRIIQDPFHRQALRGDYHVLALEKNVAHECLQPPFSDIFHQLQELFHIIYNCWGL